MNDEALKRICEKHASFLGPNGTELFNVCLLQAEAHGWTRAVLAGKLHQVIDLLTEMELVRPSPLPSEPPAE